MKKLNILLLVLTMMIVPFTVSAKDGKPVSETLAEAAKQEEIAFNHSDYKSSSSKAKIYLFRGHGCGYCHKLLEFLESIINDYGKYFDVVSYETWYDTDNYTLMKQVAQVFNESADGVPYLVIGNTTFIGYSNTYDNAIKKAIKDLYNFKDRYNVMDHLTELKEEPQNNGSAVTTDNDNTYRNESKTSNYIKENKVIIVPSIIALIIITVYVVKSTIDNKNLVAELESIKEEVKTIKVNSSNPEKETTKEYKKPKTNKRTYNKKTV